MKLKAGIEGEFEKWRLKMLNAQRMEVLRGFSEISELLEANRPTKEAAEILARSKLKIRIKLQDLGYLALAVSLFHEKGRNFRFHWNQFWQGEDWALDMEVSGRERVFSPYASEKE
ncbi:MAG: hypothetical protein HYY86_02530 [Candidatus Harrisonbacteria bacterium]|nr:hypothetical protein [Candidatus Harrisonbacteria bacterium]